MDKNTIKDLLQKLLDDFDKIKKVINIDDLNIKKNNLLKITLEENFYIDNKKASEINLELSKIEEKLKKIIDLEKKIINLNELFDIIDDEDEKLLLDFEKDIKTIKKEIKDIYLTNLFKNEYDFNNAIISIHSGAGGTEAQDWVQMLFRMYKMYCDKIGYKYKVIDLLDGNEAGIKSVIFEINGINSYGYLKSEKGVHRLVRISPFDSAGRRHTSFASVEVMPQISQNINIEIKTEDLKIDTYRSSGAGGQHVNKTDSAIRITHIPTGIVVACQNERSQIQNKEMAMKILKSKLLEKKEREQEEKRQNIQGSLKKIEWGSQIRSYIFAPYTMVKDHRTNFENTNILAVMNGDIHDFIIDYLEKSNL